jgi:hypothetical protein
MSYKDFSIKQVQVDFQLEIVEQNGLFAKVSPAEISEYFTITLQENIPLAVAINTEKARSELIICPVLVEVRKLLKRQISFFSGIEFNVDKERNLNGFCDFIVSLSPQQLFLKSPVITIVEAKNENIMSGLGQCMAAMVAGQIFNQREESNLEAIYGAVTSGVAWKFLKLQGNTIFIDLKDYNLEDKPGQVIGIFAAILR